MSRLPGSGDSPPLFSRIRFHESFDVCWAGSHPFRPGFCFGSTDGKVLFTDEEGVAMALPGKGSASGEAINGVACVGTWVAVSTRAEVSFWPLPGTEGGHGYGVAFPHGAHGITTMPSGQFVAPLGRTGIMAVRPPFGPGTEITVHSTGKLDLYAYRVIGLPWGRSSEVLACAGRSAGVGAVEFSSSQTTHTMSTVAFNDVDVVDLCPLRPGEESLAVAALGRDGSLVLFQDILHDKKPISLKFETLEGVAYRILSCLGDIFVLTSKALYMLSGLAERFTSGGEIGGATTPILVLPMEGVDANLYGTKWLLAVTSEEARRFDIRLMHDSSPLSISHGEIREFKPTLLPLVGQWREDKQTSTKEMVGAVG